MAAPETEDQIKAPDETANEATADFASELQAPVWSVISFDRREAGGLTYAEAERQLAELETQKVSGLCIVTDEVAARISVKN